jgi:hypothetical protein
MRGKWFFGGAGGWSYGELYCRAMMDLNDRDTISEREIKKRKVLNCSQTRLPQSGQDTSG